MSTTNTIQAGDLKIMAHTPMEILRNKLQFVVDELKDEVPKTYQYGYRLAMGNVIKDIDWIIGISSLRRLDVSLV